MCERRLQRKMSLRDCITNHDSGNAISDRLATELFQVKGASVDNSSIRLRPIQLGQPLDEEFFSSEVHRIAGLASAAVYTVQEQQSILIEDEDVNAPPTLWIGFLMVDEPMAMLGQDPAEPITKVIDHPLFGTASLRHRPTVGRFENGLLGKRVGWKPDGAEIGQQL